MLVLKSSRTLKLMVMIVLMIMIVLRKVKFKMVMSEMVFKGLRMMMQRYVSARSYTVAAFKDANPFASTLTPTNLNSLKAPFELMITETAPTIPKAM